MKKWIISMMAVATLLLAGSALADGSITLSPDGSTSTDASVRIDGQTVTITQAGTYQIAGTLDDGALIVESAENAKNHPCAGRREHQEHYWRGDSNCHRRRRDH